MRASGLDLNCSNLRRGEGKTPWSQRRNYGRRNRKGFDVSRKIIEQAGRRDLVEILERTLHHVHVFGRVPLEPGRPMQVSAGRARRRGSLSELRRVCGGDMPLAVSLLKQPPPGQYRIVPAIVERVQRGETG